MVIIAGLGNPGDKYKNTRHNIGWLALDFYLGEVKWTENKRFKALTYQDDEYLFIKPLTYMNLSGESLRAALSYYKLLPKSFGLINKKDADLSEVLKVVHDDVDLDFGRIKEAKDSGSAGHNGLKSIIKELKTQKFSRLKLGVKNELLKNPIPTEKFVLQNFNEEEKLKLKEIFSQINFKS
ncbi:aminoacyl-tRNA hydrolase [Candidatus Falkowbacteria bacterium]|nr:aminoacyl-tRNA hydrolase [Candidatus Falkowbacteria bacterium]NCT55038.1 aminoacyl-tRNA hydrolase [Candidatus Falkowbacteria bacterium]